MTALSGTSGGGLHRERLFFLSFLALCWLGVGMGFVPAVADRLQGRADYRAPLILHVHAAAFVGWLVLLTVQTLLVSARRASTHRTLGQLGFGLVPLMVLSGILAERYSQRFYADRDPENLRFFIIPVFYTAAFAALGGAALTQRRNPAAHKRLILLATTVIVGAAYARWWGDALAAAVGAGFWGKILETFTATNLLLLLALAYDAFGAGRVHTVYRIAMPAILAGELLVSFIYHLGGWPALARRLVGLA